MKSKKKTKLNAASIVAMALLGSSAAAMAHADKPGFEKCKGIVKAANNDCSANGHACAGMAKIDSDPNEWIFVPIGTCQKIVGGTVKPSKVMPKPMPDSLHNTQSQATRQSTVADAI